MPYKGDNFTLSASARELAATIQNYVAHISLIVSGTKRSGLPLATIHHPDTHSYGGQRRLFSN